MTSVQPVAIYLPYKNAPMIDKLLLDVDKHIKSLPLRPQNVIVKIDGIHDTRFYYEIPGAIKLFSRAIDRGLIGLLVEWGYTDTAKLCYAIANIKSRYIKRTEDGEITFPLKKDEWLQCMEKSLTAFKLLRSASRVETTTEEITESTIKKEFVIA